MTTGRSGPGGWRGWTLEIKVWKIVVALVVLAVLALWFRVVHQEDEILALIRNEVVLDGGGQRTWLGSFVNTNDAPLRDIEVTVDFLDRQERPVGRVEARSPELAFGDRLDLRSALPPDAIKLRIYSVQWRMGRTAALMGPFREPWEFGYLMIDPREFDRERGVTGLRER